MNKNNRTAQKRVMHKKLRARGREKLLVQAVTSLVIFTSTISRKKKREELS